MMPPKNAIRSGITQLVFAAFAVMGATTSWACQGFGSPTPAAASWSVTPVGHDYEVRGLNDMIGETYFYEIATSPHFPGLEVPLPAYSGSGGDIYDWVTLERYDHKIGLLQYSGGAAGTSVTVEFINNVLVDLANGQALGAANVIVTNGFDYCQVSEWTWSDDGVEVEDEGISTTLEFVFDLDQNTGQRFLDD